MAGIGKGYAAEDNDHAHEGYLGGVEDLLPGVHVVASRAGELRAERYPVQEGGYADVTHAAVNAFRSGVTLGQAMVSLVATLWQVQSTGTVIRG